MEARHGSIPGIPIGWFLVAYLGDVAPGGVKPLRYFGRDLVLFRTEDGRVSVLDAFCPHLGAHLGHGGRVEGDQLVCPFHAWRFGTDGVCAGVPYAKHMPRKAAVHPWPVKVVADMVFVWHHPRGLAPAWDIPDLVPEYADVDGKPNEEWTEWTRRSWVIRSVNQEMAENAVDAAHFRYLHGTTNIPTSVATMEGPLMRVQSPAGMTTPRGDVPGTIESRNYGFGIGFVRFTGIVETLNIGCTTPIDDDTVELRFNFKVKKMGGLETNVGKAFVNEVTRQVEQDIPIWENKVHLERPLLCDGDGPIAQFRKWGRQFYDVPAADGASA